MALYSTQNKPRAVGSASPKLDQRRAVGSASPKLDQRRAVGSASPKLDQRRALRAGNQSPKPTRATKPVTSACSTPTSSYSSISSSSRSGASPQYGDSGEVMIGESKVIEKSNVKRKLLKSEAEKILKEQLSRGKLPPKAKFRADDEISIGEPASLASNVVPRRVSEPSRLADPARSEVVEVVAAGERPGSAVSGDSAGGESSCGSAQLTPQAGQSLPPRSASKPASNYKSASLENYYRLGLSVVILHFLCFNKKVTIYLLRFKFEIPFTEKV